ncbi:hypothetical protein EON79_09235 [bacterium]|nr:MAG: hypothetical protein EON79_09235 [bacterium]
MAPLASASAQEHLEDPGYTIKPFSLLGSDGRKYDAKTLGKGKPVLLVNLTKRGFPKGVADLNRLADMTAGKVRVVGYVWASLHTMRETVKKHDLRFLLVSSYQIRVKNNQKEHSPGDIGTSLTTLNDGHLYYLNNALLLPNRKLTHIWTGYNRWSLWRMAEDARRYGHVRLKLDLATFPKALQVGER